MKRDQHFFDMYLLVIGVLAAIALAIFVLTMKMSDVTQGVFTASADEYQDAVEDRIRPFGQVYMPGEESAAMAPQVTEADPVEPVATALSGPQVYNEACNACHGNGIGGAPMLSDSANWGPRVEQGVDILNQHAIDGYTGSAGFMPPKGGRLDLSDDEISAAVEYMLSEIQ